MTATIPDDVTTATKTKRLGLQSAFGSDTARGLTAREYIATALMPACMIDDATPAEHAAAAAVRFADALLIELAK